MVDIDSMGNDDLQKRILSKDENLQKRGIIFDTKRTIPPVQKDGNIEERLVSLFSEALERNNNALKSNESKISESPKVISSDPNSSIVNVYQAEAKQTNDALATLFGGGGMRRDGEKTVERTVTITIRDNVVE